MKPNLITAVIAVITGISGYYIAKQNLCSCRCATPAKIDKATKSNNLHSDTDQQKPLPFSAKCKIQFGITARSPHNSQVLFSKHYFQTHFNAIKSLATIDRAIQDYALDELTAIDKKQLATLISKTLKISQIRGTDLCEVQAFGNTEEQAQKILYAVLHSYRDSQKEHLQSERESAFAQFKENRKLQEKRVEIHRKKLYEMSKKFGIPYHEVNSEQQPKQSGIVSAEEHTQFGKARDEYEREFLILKAIMDAEFRERIEAEIEITPLHFHQHRWSPEFIKSMQAKKEATS